MSETSQCDRILDSAYECISSRGYANVSLRHIAEEAGVALSQLHYYFGSKKELFIAVVKKVATKYLEEAELQLSKGKTPVEKTSQLIAFFQQLLEHNPELFRLLFDFTSLALWSDSFRVALSSLFGELSNMIEEFVKDSACLKESMKPYGSKSVARLILGALLGTGIQAILDPSNKELVASLNAVQMVFE